MRILAGDIGGTKTYLSLFDQEPDGSFREVRSKRFVSADFNHLEPMLEEFLKLQDGPRPKPVQRAGFGVAGPVVGGRCAATNLPWELEAGSLGESIGGEVRLVNDFYAVALGITCLQPSDLQVLQDGTVDPMGPIAIVGAGTGLGKATMLRTESGLRIVPSEGAHRDFAARNEDEIGLLRFMLRRHAPVSYDQVVSGRGIRAVYEYLVSTGEPEHPKTKARMETEDWGAVIGEHALSGEDPLCVRTIDMFLGMYGAEAGNVALHVLPTGGLYLAGGIAPRLLPLIEKGGFMEAFTFKGRMSNLAKSFRVSVIKQTRVGLLGAARAALGDDTTDVIRVAES